MTAPAVPARRRWRPWRPLMLHTRFTVVVALAVAAVTLGIAAVAFFVLRSDLENQVKQELLTRSATVHHLAYRYHGHIPSRWVPPQSDRFGVASPYTQLVTAGGDVWAPADGTGLLPATAAAGQVAAGHRAAYYSQTTLDGVHAMVLTAPLAPGLAVQMAEPLDTVDAEVASVATTLALLSAVGVGLVALAGRGVARAGLAPVGRLAAVAEQVTATGHPVGRVEVHRPDELGRLATSFNKMLNALQRSLDAQQQLVADASHELRTPLTSLRINAELLAAHPGLDEAERQEILDRVVAQVAELGDLVANLTELARGESATAMPEDVELHTTAAACLRAAQQDWPGTPFSAELEPAVVFGSAGRLRIAVRNLLDNAAKFSPPGAPVTVRLSGGELTVRDQGPGIAPADLPHVFDRFYRSPSARGVPGSGLGLAIVRQVAEEHGGTVRAESAPGHGTVIRLGLPVAACPAPDASPVTAAGAARSGAVRAEAAHAGAARAGAAEPR